MTKDQMEQERKQFEAAVADTELYLRQDDYG